MRIARHLFPLAAALGGSLLVAQAPPAPAATGEPARPKLTISWSTASEVDNYGFLVLRGETEEGPFKVVTEKAIPGAGTSDLPHKYTFEDSDVVQGKIYYYYLESISLQGVREKFSPVVSKTCCEAAKDAAPSAAPAVVPR